MYSLELFFLLIFFCTALFNHCYGQPIFTVMPLGTKGGSLQASCSSYLLSCPDTNGTKYIALDSGTILDGLKKTADEGYLDLILDMVEYNKSGLTKENYFLAEQLAGYFVTHAHLDHLSGLIISSPDEKGGAKKPIISRVEVIDSFKEHVFNSKLWDDFVLFGFFKYIGLNVTNMSPVPLNNDCPGLEIANAFHLSHPSPCTAFLLRNQLTDKYVLFFGDTGPDEVYENNNMANVWHTVAPLIMEKKLLAIFLECSYPDPRDRNKLYGHLSPEWMDKELKSLASIITSKGGDSRLTNLTIIVTHIKTSKMNNADPSSLIHKQLLEYQDKSNYAVNFIIPKVGKLIYLKDIVISNPKIIASKTSEITTSVVQSDTGIAIMKIELNGFILSLIFFVFLFWTH